MVFFFESFPKAIALNCYLQAYFLRNLQWFEGFPVKNVKEILFGTVSRKFSNTDPSRKLCVACMALRKTKFILRGSCSDSLIGTKS